MVESAHPATANRLRELLGEERLIAVLRSRDARAYEPVVEVLVTSGIRTIELTLTTPGALEELPRLVDRFGTKAAFGVGTVLTRANAMDAIDAGAQFLVTPALVPEVIDHARERRVAMLSGAFTPTEINATIRLGADGVKLFPASSVGPNYLRELRGPLPGLDLVPSGGVAICDIQPWLSAGALAVSLGGALIGDAFAGDLRALRERAKLALAAAHQMERV